MTGWHRKHAVRAPAQSDCPSGRGGGIARAQAFIRRDDQRCIDGTVGGIGSRLRQAAQDHDPNLAAIRREVPIRTFNDWNSPPPGFCGVDMVAHGGIRGGSFIQTLTMVDAAPGWTECRPLLTRDGPLIAECDEAHAEPISLAFTRR